MPISTYTDGVGDALRSIGDYATGLVTPTVRLGVTGLARSGKTVFITALVHNLIAGARLPFFDASAEGRLAPRLSGAAAGRRCAAIRVRVASRRSHGLAAALAGEHPAHQPASPHAGISKRGNSGSVSSAATGCISTSSTILANGCSTCRCSASTIANGHARPSSRPARLTARRRQRSGARHSAKSIRQAPATRRSRRNCRTCSRPI